MQHWTHRHLGSGSAWLVVGLFTSGSAGAQLQITLSNRPSPGVDLQVTGAATGINHQLEVADDLLPTLWDPITTFSTPDGIFDFTDNPSSNHVRRFYRARRIPFPTEIAYLGDALTLVYGGFNPGNEVQFDFDGNGEFEESATVGPDGILTAVFDVAGLPTRKTISYRILNGVSPITPTLFFDTVRRGTTNRAQNVPLNTLPGTAPVREPGIAALSTSRLGVDYSHSRTPHVHGVDLVTGKTRRQLPVAFMKGRRLDVSLDLHHASCIEYDGPYGKAISHRYNMMIVQRNSDSGHIITPDLRIFDIRTSDGINWTPPDGFDSRLTLDADQRRWRLTHFSGHSSEFLQGLVNQPGPITALHEPNGNVVRFDYNGAGYLVRIRTSLEQEQVLTYGHDNRLVSFSDHLGHTWKFGHDESGRLDRIQTPSTEYLNVAVNELVVESDIESLLTVGPRSLTLTYDPSFPTHLASMTDARGAVPIRYAYDAAGRVRSVTINGATEEVVYSPQSRPEPLGELDPGNVITRVIDRDGNICDYEIHDETGGLNGAGAGGLRRRVQWTETGAGGTPLRPGEPVWWQTRWLYDSDDLKPTVVTQPFSNIDAFPFTYDAKNIPLNWPRTEYTYTANRQTTVDLYTDGTDSIRREYTYQASSFGDSGQYARLLTATDPRQFDNSPLYADLIFTHRYQYDARGNLIQHTAPTVTRGTAEHQVIVRGWDYDHKGEITGQTDGSGNVTIFDYHEGGPSTGGDINTAQLFNGFLKSVTVGATGSSDSSVNATTTFKVNALGMVTEATDPEGNIYRYEFNALGELVRTHPPVVSLFTGAKAQYDTRYFYDAAGNRVMARRKNLKADGIVGPKTWTTTSKRHDAVNNITGLRTQVDTTAKNDLIVNYAYDPNDQLIVIERPEGNRTFITYDERGLPLRRFYGVAPGGSTTQFYPPRDADTTLDPGDAGVGVETFTYDARGNLVTHEDGRGNTTWRFYDFYNRPTSRSDPNGNGTAYEYDDAGLVLTEDYGSVSRATGLIEFAQARSYHRYDELGRRYMTTYDIQPSSDERLALDPTVTVNSSYTHGYDLSHRLTRGTNARGHDTTYAYDAADRLISSTDPMGNTRRQSYDQNSNVTQVSDDESSEGNPLSVKRTYVTSYVYDERNRLVETHILGENGASIDHAHRYAYDSRNNRVLHTDAERNVEFSTYDLLNRRTLQQRYDGNPLVTEPTELRRSEWAYDGNSRLVEQRVWANVLTAGSIQSTRHAYDDLDRVVRTVHPDSDDPIAVAGNGADGQYDRIEYEYDENSNQTRVTDQRGVVFDQAFDAGNRLVKQSITPAPNVGGDTFKGYAYDVLNRVTSVSNNYAKCDFGYDALSRLRDETQSIRLDGTGARAGYEQPIDVKRGYDKDSNLTRREVLDGADTDMEVATIRDALNRPDVVLASYLRQPAEVICDYHWFGPVRSVGRTLGNGAKLAVGYDNKRRPDAYQWTEDVSSDLLVGFAQDYTQMDRVRFERFQHDGDRYDHFLYNDRYELEGAEFRSADSAPPVLSTTRFSYDDNQNRVEARYQGPFGRGSLTIDSYANNGANEYTTLTRTTAPLGLPNPMYDRAGNPSLYTLRAPSASPDGTDGSAFFSWDSNGRLFSLSFPASGNPDQQYRYDPLGRRIAVLEGSVTPVPVRRFIWCGSDLMTERLFDDRASLSDAPSTLERIYVPGLQPDSPLLCAIDGNADGSLGGAAKKNISLPNADQEFYYLDNRQGTAMALLDADNDERILEYYRYDAFGSPLVLPVVDGNADTLEDTPLDLTDNAAGAQRGLSPYRNVKFRDYMDTATGLYYARNRYYDPTTGRLLNRNRNAGAVNPYGYAGNNPVTVPGKQTWEYDEIHVAHVPTAAPDDHMVVWGVSHEIASPEDVSPAPMFNPTTLTVKKTVPWSAAAHVYQHNQSDLAFLRQRAQGRANEQQYFTIPLENATISSIPRDHADAVDHPDFAWVPYANEPEPPPPPSWGDIYRPIIVGGLWNGQDAPPTNAEDQKRPPKVLVVWGRDYPQLNGGGDSFHLNGWGAPRVAVARWYLENAWPVKQAVSPQRAGGHNEYVPDDSPGWSAPRGSAGNSFDRKFTLF